MLDSSTQSLLRDHVRRESRSLLAYVRDAYPWAAAEESEALTTLRRLIREEEEAVAALGRFLARRRVALPPFESYPSSFTSINFVALDYLLPRLVEYQRHSLGDLERDLARVKDPDARAQVQGLIDLKRRHLSSLEELAAQHREPAVTT